MRKVILFSRDPGGANVIIPLVNPLREKGYIVKLFGKDYALTKYKQVELDGINIDNYLEDVTVVSLTKFLQKEMPDIIITGTSANDFTEKYLWKAAEKLKIPSFAILDQWMSYGIRFSEFNLSQIDKYNVEHMHCYFPTKILVMDEYAKEMMVEDGIEISRVKVVGQPYFNYLFDKAQSINKQEILDYKMSINCFDDDIIVTFATEAISQTYNEDSKALESIGYTDKTILYEVYQCIKSISFNYNKKIKLIIRLHPKDESSTYIDFLSRIEDKDIEVTIDKDTDTLLIISASDIICGMSSMFLIEATILGKPIISAQIGLKGQNPFVFNQNGLMAPILTHNELYTALSNLIVNKSYCKYCLEFNRDAIKKIIKLVEDFI